MRIVNTLTATMLIVPLITSCGVYPTGGATETALCEIWGESLPTRSRSDTAQTQQEIQAAYADFLNACPEWAHLI